MNKTKALSKTAEQLQRSMASAIMRPLVDDSIDPMWVNDLSMADFAASFIRPNDRLTSAQRLAIYNQQYWYRLLDSLQDDFPGLNTVLGEERFAELSIAYLVKHPSTSFTLRNLGSQLYNFACNDFSFVDEKEKRLVLDMIIFEWSEIEAFDGEALKPLDGKALEGLSAGQIRLKLQPHISILSLKHAVDQFLLQLKKGSKERTLVSANAPSKRKHATKQRLPREEEVFVVVHRQDNDVYYKRIDSLSYTALSAIKSGSNLMEACSLACDQLTDQNIAINALAEKFQKDFFSWVKLGWFVMPSA